MAKKDCIPWLFTLTVILLINIDPAATQEDDFAPVITSHTQSHLKTDATSVDLYCEVEAWPTPKFAWYRNGTEVHDIKSITSEIKVNDKSKPRFRSSVTVPVSDGLYQCSARNVRGLALSPIIHLQATGDTDTEDVNMCEDGMPGLPGLPGLEGPQGLKGTKGEQGPQGLSAEYVDGMKGATGERGATGRPGRRGETGPMGLPGLRGDKGPPGYGVDDALSVMKGEKGTKGKDGPKGWRGPNGFKGDGGLAGSQGEKGEPGVAGTQGDRGLPGLPGVCGCT